MGKLSSPPKWIQNFKATHEKTKWDAEVEAIRQEGRKWVWSWSACRCRSIHCLCYLSRYYPLPSHTPRASTRLAAELPPAPYLNLSAEEIKGIEALTTTEGAKRQSQQTAKDAAEEVAMALAGGDSAGYQVPTIYSGFGMSMTPRQAQVQAQYAQVQAHLAQEQMLQQAQMQQVHQMQQMQQMQQQVWSQAQQMGTGGMMDGMMQVGLGNGPREGQGGRSSLLSLSFSLLCSALLCSALVDDILLLFDPGTDPSSSPT